jgi:subtilisin
MSRRLNLFASVLACGLLALFGGTSATAQREPGARVPESARAQALGGRPVRIIVGVRGPFAPEGGLDAQARSAQRAEIGERLRAVMSRLPAVAVARGRAFTTIPFFAAEVDAVTLLQLEQDPDVVSIEEDVAVPPTLEQSTAIVGATTAWSAGFTGSGWAVAILDTGVDKSHSFMGGRVVSEACYSNGGGGGEGQTSLCPGGAASSTASGSGVNCTGYNACAHGTHVAGIAAGAGSSFNGVAPAAGVIAIQVFTGFPAEHSLCGGAPCALSFTSDQIAGLERVLALRTTLNIAAVNMSLGGGRFTDQPTCDAANTARKAIIDSLRSAGIATVIASGNDGFADALSSPGCISSAVSVASTTKLDEVSSFSNAASFLSLLAPGSQITSSVPGGFSSFNGTSMAAPHVAGAWALVKQRKPWASVTEILTALRDTGVPVIDPLSGLTFPRIRVDQAIATLISTEMSLDAPASGAMLPTSFNVAGWAIDRAAGSGTGVDAVHVYATPAGGTQTFLGAAKYGGERGDVGDVFGSRFENSGFWLTVTGLLPGTYEIATHARSTVTGAFNTTRSATVTVSGPLSNPIASIDGPANGATVGRSFAVAGWAIDREAPSGTGVDAIHVYAFPTRGSPTFLGVGSYGGARPDVGGVFGSQFTNSGYALTVNSSLTAGDYELAVYFRSTITGAFASAVQTITVREPGDPRMSLDTPSNGASASQPFLLAGWAIDRDAPAGTGVDALHVWAFPADGSPAIFLGTPEYGFARPDVGSIFGPQFTSCGFNLAVKSLADGSYQIVVYARSTVTGSFSQFRVVTVSVDSP